MTTFRSLAPLLALSLLAPANALDWNEEVGAQVSAVLPPAEASCTPRELFARPLITGASISADHMSVSPGMLLARRFGTSGAAVKAARAGAHGRNTVAELSDAAITNATVVVAVDLFFWDATDASCGHGESAVDSFFSRMKAQRKPVVIGNIPLLERRMHCREALNARIKASCAAYSSCYFLDLDGAYVKIQADGGLTVTGRKYSMRELLPDGRHPGLVCSEYMAERIVDVITRGGERDRVPCGY